MVDDHSDQTDAAADLLDASVWAKATLALLTQRGLESSACPSEVARALAPDHWRDHMDTVRRVAWQLCLQGTLEVLQKGQPVKAGPPWRGPVRLRLRKPEL